MAKKVSTKSSSSVAEVNEQKKRQKQAKREAKMMLEIEETKASIERLRKNLLKHRQVSRHAMHISTHLKQIYLSFALHTRKLK